MRTSHRGPALGRLFFAAVAICTAPVAIAQAPDAPPAEWDELVAKAVSDPRYGVRRAASNRAAQRGLPAIAAVRRWMQQHGTDSVPLLLVDAFASRGITTHPEETAELLRQWADDDAFYWRARALEGLANARMAEDEERFVAGLTDASWTFRAASALGLALRDENQQDGDPVWRRVLDHDPDPRARCEVAADLAFAGRDDGVGWLLAGFELAPLVFLDDPWGQRVAARCLAALRVLSGTSFEDADEARAWAKEQDYAAARWPGFDADAERGFDRGIEVRSCRTGDRFVRWDADGRSLHGLLPTADRITEEPIAVDTRRVPASFGDDDLGGVQGELVCDFLRLRAAEPDGVTPFEIKAAPGGLPRRVAEWLETFAAQIGSASGNGDAAPLPAVVPPVVIEEFSGR